MKLPARFTFALAALLVPAALLSAGCGDKPTDVEEGEPLDLGGLIYNVAITRFLNPADTEDQAYLAGMPPPPKNKDYLAVFLTIKNEGDDPLPSAHTYIVTDTIGDTFRPLEVKNDYALGVGTKVGADDRCRRSTRRPPTARSRARCCSS